MTELKKMIEESISATEKLLKENIVKTEALLNEFKTAQAPYVDSVKEQYNRVVKNNFYMEKTLANLKKSLKHLKKHS